MSNIRTLTGLLVGATLLLSACTMGTAGYQATSTNPGASTAAGAVTIGTADVGALGTVLTGPDGRTLYTHGGDAMNSSTCTGACLTAWPPVTIAGGQQVTAGPGVSGKLGSFPRPDGTQWVTYDGLPLYGWQGDEKFGDATGQGVNGFVVATAAGAAAIPGDAAAPPANGGGYSY
jgi:predicted lipoprotein with Yx(FWY)xxD motif